jgi:hypothetical protein
LKKQSQFVPGLIGVTSYLKGNYDKYPLFGARKNKPNLSLGEQSQSYLAPRPELGVEKTKPIPGIVPGNPMK